MKKLLLITCLIILSSCEENEDTLINFLIITESFQSNNDCNYGGVYIFSGLDYNNNNVLDEYEINEREFICNGSDGAVGQTVPAFRVHKNGTDQTVTTNTYTKITWTTEEFDTTNDFDLTNDRFTPSIAGRYALHFTFYANATAGYKGAVIYKNGALYTADWAHGDKGGSTISTIVDANGTSDYFEAYVYSADTDIRGQTHYTSFSGHYLPDTTSGGNASSGSIEYSTGTFTGSNLTANQELAITEDDGNMTIQGNQFLLKAGNVYEVIATGETGHNNKIKYFRYAWRTVADVDISRSAEIIPVSGDFNEGSVPTAFAIYKPAVDTYVSLDIISVTGTGQSINGQYTIKKLSTATTTGNANDNDFEILNNTDNTKKIKFDASQITTGTTRTLTAPDQNGTIALTSDVPIETTGSGTVPNADSGVVTFATAGITAPAGKVIYGFSVLIDDGAGAWKNHDYGYSVFPNQNARVAVDITSEEIDFFGIGVDFQGQPFRIIIKWAD